MKGVCLAAALAQVVSWREQETGDTLLEDLKAPGVGCW